MSQASRVPGRRALVVALLAACLCGHAAGSQEDGAQDEAAQGAGARSAAATATELAELLSVSVAEAGEAGLARRAEEFARAHGAVAAYLEYTSTHAAPPGLDARTRLEQVADLLPAEQLAADVRRALDEPHGLAWRLAALELVGRRIAAERMELAVDLVADSSEGELAAPLLGALRDALVAIAARDPRFFEELGGLTVVRAELAVEVVRAVGQTGDLAGLDWLAGQLRDADLCGAVLGELRRLAPQVPAAKGVALSERVRPFLESEHQHERRAAMAVLARLGDATAVPRMLELLEHGDAGERHEAHDALRTLSACQFPNQVASWRAWYERERVWWEEQSQQALEQLGSDDPALVVAAVRSVGDRSLRRERLAAELAPLVEHDAPAVRAYACAGLGQLRVAATVEALVGALDDEEPAVRTQALRALRAITGKDLPPEREAWSRALDA